MAGNYREYRTRQEMVEHGWKINPLNSECRNCHAEITWSTSPRGKKVPLDVNSTELHFKSCSNSQQSKSIQTANSGRNSVAPNSSASDESAALREALDECAQAVRELCRILRARAEGAR